MVDTPSNILLLRLMSTGSQNNLWGGYLNAAMQTIERAAKGYQTLAVTGDATIAWANYTTTNDGEVAFLKLTGAASAAVLTFPSLMHLICVNNSGASTVTIKCAGGVGVAIPAGRITWLYCDGTDYYSATATWSNVTNVPTNPGDSITFDRVAVLIANAGLPASSGALLNSPSDTVAGYLSQKLNLLVAGLLIATWSTENPGGDENSLLYLDDRRTRRRALFVGQV